MLEAFHSQALIRLDTVRSVRLDSARSIRLDTARSIRIDMQVRSIRLDTVRSIRLDIEVLSNRLDGGRLCGDLRKRCNCNNSGKEIHNTQIDNLAKAVATHQPKQIKRTTKTNR